MADLDLSNNLVQWLFPQSSLIGYLAKSVLSFLPTSSMSCHVVSFIVSFITQFFLPYYIQCLLIQL